MTQEGIVRAVFDLSPIDCEKSNFLVTDPAVGLATTGKALYQLFPYNLRRFQVESIQALLGGNDLFLAVGTAAGKTEAFLFPLLEEIVAKKNDGVITIYPTKQLAEDQEQRLAKYCEVIRSEIGRTITYSRYNGDLSKKDLAFIEKAKPNVLLATLDKLFYRLFKPENPAFLDWLKNARAIVFDEIHAGSGSYLAHVREFIAVYKRINPSGKIILSSATVNDLETFRNNFLPSARIIKSRGRRGIIRVMVLRKEAIEELIIQKLDPYLRKIKGACLIFVDSVTKVSQLVAKCNEALAKATGIPLEIVKNNSPFVCISSQLEEWEKTDILRRIREGSIRFVFTTSLLELGMDIPNIEHIINIGWPITGKNGLLQRLGRLRFGTDLSQKKNFTIILDPENPYDHYYLKHPDKIREILDEGMPERVLFNSKSLQNAKAFVLFRVVMGITKVKEIFALCPDKEAEQTMRTALSLLFASGLLRTKDHQLPFLERRVVLADEQEVWCFIRSHRIRAIENKWAVVEVLPDGKERQIGSIEERRIIRGALPGNLLHQGSKGVLYRVKSLAERKVRVEPMKLSNITVQGNKLKPPIFLIDPHARVQQLGKTRALFGKMIIRWETATIARYDRAGKLIEETLPGRTVQIEGNSITNGFPDEEGFEPLDKYQWDQKTSGLLLSLDYPAEKLSDEEKMESLKLFKNLLLKGTEIALHLSESSFSCLVNKYENQILLYDRGGSMGNAELLFVKIKKVLQQMFQMIVERKQQDLNTQSNINPLFDELSPKVIHTTQQLLEEMI